jgi:hypothetical protein
MRKSATALSAHVARALQPAVDLECTVNKLVGAFYARYLVDSRIPTSYPRQLVAIVWNRIRSQTA